MACTCPTHITEAAKPRYTEAGTIVDLQEESSNILLVSLVRN